MAGVEAEVAEVDGFGVVRVVVVVIVSVTGTVYVVIVKITVVVMGMVIYIVNLETFLVVNINMVLEIFVYDSSCDIDYQIFLCIEFITYSFVYKGVFFF